MSNLYSCCVFKLASLAVAKSILHQVTAALAVAEQELHFEHRYWHTLINYSTDWQFPKKTRTDAVCSPLTKQNPLVFRRKLTNVQLELYSNSLTLHTVYCRDLHWGNVLVKTTKQKTGSFLINGTTHSLETRGVLVRIIDYSLSRLEIGQIFFYLLTVILWMDCGIHIVNIT